MINGVKLFKRLRDTQNVKKYLVYFLEYNHFDVYDEYSKYIKKG